MLQLARGMTRIVDVIRADALRLLRAAIEARVLILSIAVDYFWVARIGNHEARFAAAGRKPVARPDHTLIVEARDGQIGIILLRAVNIIRKLIVGRDVVELARGLVVLRRPGVAALDGNA